MTVFIKTIIDITVKQIIRGLKMKNAILILLFLSSTSSATELHRIADLNQKKVTDNAVISTKGHWNNLDITLNGTTDPNDVNAAMYGTCNVDMDKSAYSHSVKKSDEGNDIHEYSYTADQCKAKVEIIDMNKQEARVTLSDQCQVYCGVQGDIHSLDGYYRQ